MSYSPAIINRVSGGTIPAFTIVKKGADDNTVVAAAAATDKLLGVTAGPTQNSSVTGDRVDIVVAGIGEVLAGGSFVVGDKLTSDGNGKAIVSAAAAGTNNPIVGVALKDAASGDIVQILVSPQTYQG
jgi:hypothetical protein